MNGTGLSAGVRTRLTPAAATVLVEAERLAADRGCLAPVTSELLASLLLHGADDPRLAVALARAREAGDPFALLSPVVDEDPRSTSAIYRALLIRVGLRPLGDCLDLAAVIAEHPALPSGERGLLERILAPVGAASATVADPDDAVPTVVMPGDPALLVAVASDLRAGRTIVLSGPRGTMPLAVARACLRHAGIDALEASADEDPSTTARLAREAGALLLWGDDPLALARRVPGGVPAIIAVEQGEPPAPSGSMAVHAVPSLPAAETATLLADAFGLRSELATSIVERAVRYLPIHAALPGAAIDLVLTARGLGATELGEDELDLATAALSGLPVALVSDRERERLRTLAARLRERVVGQDAAIEAVVNVIVRRMLDLGRDGRPLAVLLFLGPTGVGKTTLARAIAEVLYGSADECRRYDMSEYRQSYEMSKLIGSAPGLVGSDREGALIRDLRAHPHGVFLLDEIEKADPAFDDLMLGVFDAARITSNQGRLVSARDALFVMTSNVGERERPRRRLGFTHDRAAPPPPQSIEVRRHDALRRRFSPEFLGRIDAVLEFSPLGRDELATILDREIAAIAERFRSYGIEVRISEGLRGSLLDAATGSESGARELVLRLIPRRIADRLTRALLDGAYRHGAIFTLDEGPDGSTDLREEG